MGLFDFVRNVGNKIFHRDEEAAQKIREHIEQNNPGINNLGVEYDPATGKASLSGDAADPAALQKAVLMAGNVEGVAEVNVDKVKVKGTVEDVKVEYYIIKSGDTLSKIAKQYYGDANQYSRIFEANREVIKHPDKIFPGQKIRIPPG
jgi:nucleoid-associated protein YgaU